MHFCEVFCMSDIEVKIDKLGRIVIPKKYRATLGVDVSSALSLTLKDDSVIIRAIKKKCVICGCADPLLDGYCVCYACARKIKDRFDLG